MKSDTALGAYGDGDYTEMGQVDLFGLDEFGQPVGMNPLWGAVIGGGIGTGTAIAVRALSAGYGPGATTFDYHKWSEGIGFAVGAATSGLLMAFPGTRAAGWAGMAVTFMTNGLRQLEQMFTETATPAEVIKKLEEKGVHLDAAVIEQLNGVTIESLSPGTRDVQGFGVADIEEVPEAYGTIPGVYGTEMGVAVAGPQIATGTPPIDLMAAGALPQSAYHVGLMNGPALSGLGAHYGATLFGGE